MRAHPVGDGHVLAGIVSGLWRYPVKSMAGEALARTDMSWAGLAGDRRWAFIRPDAQDSGFRWHTIREFPGMAQCVALLSEPARPDHSRVLVRTPDGGVYSVTDPRLAAELGPGLRVMRLNRGAFDAMPVSVISDATVSALCALADMPGNELRFRPNVVVTLDSGTPFGEDEWIGSAVRIGSAVVRMDRKDSRCTIVDVDPASGLPDAHLLKVIGANRAGCAAGVYGTTVRPGLIRVGDPVIVGYTAGFDDLPIDTGFVDLTIGGGCGRRRAHAGVYEGQVRCRTPFRSMPGTSRKSRASSTTSQTGPSWCGRTPSLRRSRTG